MYSRTFGIACIAIGAVACGKVDTSSPADSAPTTEADTGPSIVDSSAETTTDSGSSTDSFAMDVPTDAGPCGPVSAEGGSTRLATGTGMVGAVAVTGGYVYWIEPDNSTVFRVSASGGCPVTVATKQWAARYISARGDTVAWTAFGTAAASYEDGFVEAYQPSTAKLITLAPSQTKAFGIAVDGVGDVFWSAGGGALGVPAVFRKTAGGASQTIGNGPAGYVSVDSSHVYWTGIDSVHAASLDGSSGDVLVADHQFQVAAVVGDDTSVFWMIPGTPGSGTGEIVKGTIGGTPTLIASSQPWPRAIAVDSGSVYWANGSDARIMAASKTDGSKKTIVTASHAPTAIAVDDSRIYWATFDGLVYSISK